MARYSTAPIEAVVYMLERLALALLGLIVAVPLALWAAHAVAEARAHQNGWMLAGSVPFGVCVFWAMTQLVDLIVTAHMVLHPDVARQALMRVVPIDKAGD